MDFSDQLLEPARPAPRPSASTGSGATTPAADLPAITVTARTTPPGAAVWVRGTRMGITPLTFRFQDASAKVGGTLTMALRLAGHENETVRHTITGDSAVIDTVLEPKGGELAPPVEAQEEEEEETEEETEEDPLRELEERAKQLEAPDPVLKITESPNE
jgi:hypothetical protein